MVTSTKQEGNVEQEMVYARLHDASVLWSVYPIREARNILFHERYMCDDCLVRGKAGSVYLFPGDRGGHSVMMLLCDDCIDNIGGPLDNKEFSK